MNMSSLTGKVAVITGGSRGIGLATARVLLAHGANVAITGTHASTVSEGRDELVHAASADRVIAEVADVRSYEAVDRLLGRVADSFGGIDVLVNNAGVGVFKPVGEMTVADWHTVVDTNLTGVFYCCHAALPRLRAPAAAGSSTSAASPAAMPS